MGNSPRSFFSETRKATLTSSPNIPRIFSFFLSFNSCMHLCCSSGTDSSTCDADDVVASAAANAAAPIHTHGIEHTRSDGRRRWKLAKSEACLRRPPPAPDLLYAGGESGAARFFMHTREAKVGRKSGSRRLGGVWGSRRRFGTQESRVRGPGAAGCRRARTGKPERRLKIVSDDALLRSSSSSFPSVLRSYERMR